MMGLKLKNSCKLAIVDDEDYERCALVKWKVANGHVVGRFHREPITLENFVLWKFDDDPEGVEHIDGDKFDCRKCNLRAGPKIGNPASPKPKIVRQRTESTYKGVTWSWAMDMWEARIELPTESRHILYTKNETQAAVEYDLAVLQCFRKIDPATLNFPISEYGLTRQHLV